MKVVRKTFPKREEQKERVKKSLKDRAYVEGEIPKTGRSFTNYSVQLFPDIETSQLLSHLKDKNYLDLACGINHMYNESLLCQLAKDSKGKRRDGLDIHSEKQTSCPNVNYYKGTSLKTNLRSNTYDCITINNYLYFWEYNTKKLIQIYKELFRILKPGGELRIFPIFFSNYHNDNVELFDLINELFFVKCLRPKKDYSKESPIYIEKSEVKKTHARNGLNEYRINHELMAQVLILKKS